ncbi:MAG: PEP-CTERM sorting domain-containing protein [Thiobacillus sp.]|uniref:PEP-CTERM sorting domain-containing protein n=1 Tax=Thiobacillus sp. TaxID=924 RepID=UPI002737683D|nr:PEP-CTERM sorting domain-containing protein [Thiobacillus sp.]MDP3584463.1 PEP-CTERM sorting domain-containing protein [Thiobacillus sp.]
MNFKMTKIAAAVAMAMAANGAYALSVTSVQIADTINATTNALGTDGREGAFRFGNINTTTYTGASLWFGDLNGGMINMSGGAPLQFTSGFSFAGADFQPFNAKVNGGVVVPGSGAITWSTSAAADAAAVGTVLSGSDLIISNFDWAGYYVGANFNFAQSPDAAPNVLNFIKTGSDEYAFRLSFQHDITTADDPSQSYTTQTARWVLEGTISTAAPIPEASTYGMMLAGLGLVGAVVARRRRSV